MDKIHSFISLKQLKENSNLTVNRKNIYTGVHYVF